MLHQYEIEDLTADDFIVLAGMLDGLLNVQHLSDYDVGGCLNHDATELRNRDISRIIDQLNLEALDLLAQAGGLNGAEVWTLGGSKPDAVVHHCEMLCLEGSDEPTPVLIMEREGGWYKELYDLDEQEFLQPPGARSYGNGGTVELLKAHAKRLDGKPTTDMPTLWDAQPRA